MLEADAMTHGEFVTDLGATAALSSPWWLPSLHTASEIAGLLFPILGGIWLAVQISIKLYLVIRGRID